MNVTVGQIPQMLRFTFQYGNLVKRDFKFPLWEIFILLFYTYLQYTSLTAGIGHSMFTPRPLRYYMFKVISTTTDKNPLIMM